MGTIQRNAPLKHGTGERMADEIIKLLEYLKNDGAIAVAAKVYIIVQLMLVAAVFAFIIFAFCKIIKSFKNFLYHLGQR